MVRNILDGYKRQIQSNPAMVVNPDKIMGAPRLVTILTDNSFAVYLFPGRLSLW